MRMIRVEASVSTHAFGLLKVVVFIVIEISARITKCAARSNCLRASA